MKHLNICYKVIIAGFAHVPTVISFEESTLAPGKVQVLWHSHGKPNPVRRRDLGMGSTNERRRYIVTPSLIGWAHTRMIPESSYRNILWIHTMGCPYIEIASKLDRGIYTNSAAHTQTMWM